MLPEHKSLLMLKHSFSLCCFCWLLLAAQAACVKLPRRQQNLSGHTAAPAVRVEPASAALINLNTATGEELERLPGIGQALAARIISHRERYGRFRRAEHLLLVRGISERRYQAVSRFLKVE